MTYQGCRQITKLLGMFALLMLLTSLIGCGTTNISPSSVVPSPTPQATSPMLMTSATLSTSTPTQSDEFDEREDPFVTNPKPTEQIMLSVPTLAPAGGSYTSEQAHITTSFDQRWTLPQDKTLHVTVQEIEEPLILAVLAAYLDPPIMSKPMMGEHLKELEGTLFVHQVNPDATNAMITFPAEQIDYCFNLHIFLTTQLDFYALEYNDEGLRGSWHSISPQDVPTQQTMLYDSSAESMKRDQDIALITIPQSAAGFFRYAPRDAVVDTLILPDDAIMDLDR